MDLMPLVNHLALATGPIPVCLQYSTADDKHQFMTTLWMKLGGNLESTIHAHQAGLDALVHAIKAYRPTSYIPLVIPVGVESAVRHQHIRAIAQYEINTDRIAIRIDSLLVRGPSSSAEQTGEPQPKET